MSAASNLPAPLAISDFAAFFRALYKRRPFQWQQHLAAQVCTGQWPDYIKLPTSSGKTAVIDIAVFALAYQAAKENRLAAGRGAPRRIFFVVDRRIIVNEAYQRAHAMAKKLRDALAPQDVTSHVEEDDAILVRVAQWLQNLTGSQSAPPLDCFELRGGIYRDDAWIRSPLQPTVLTSTVDQVGSRLLFRGYGSSNRNLPIHAALTANDSLIVLDEAHCSGPFSETMQAIGRYCGEGWSQVRAINPLRFVQMTATPPQVAAQSVFELQDGDYTSDPALAQRHRCAKPISLVEAPGAKGKNKFTAVLARKLVEQAVALAADGERQKIAIVVNRVAVARAAYTLLHQKHAGRVSLMIGRMRPRDREQLTGELQRQFGSRITPADEALPSEGGEPLFLVATQCVEVGADLDFDGMVCQCASLDALRQRFGRLNRLGQAPRAAGVIVGAEEDVASPDKLDDTQPRDPIYGNALARTWHWLSQQAVSKSESNGDAAATVVDFGVEALERLIRSAAAPDGIEALSAPAPHAPVLMPAHVDMLCQTSPRPSLEPDISAYLHGVGREGADVQVCWRADFNLNSPPSEESLNDWLATVDACPPSSTECLSVPLHSFRQWLRDDPVTGDSGDVIGGQLPLEDSKPATRTDRTVLVWRGRQIEPGAAEASFLANGSNDRRLRPGDTIVIPAEFGGWKALGHVPNAPPDPAEQADQVCFTTTDPVQLHRLLMRDSDAGVEANEPVSNAASEQTAERVELARIDIADDAFLQAQAKTRWRIHPKLKPAPQLRSLWKALLKAADDPDSDLNASQWRTKAAEISGNVDQAVSSGDALNAGLLQRLVESNDQPYDGKLTRYPKGVIWVTPRHRSSKPGMLPLTTFGDDEDSLSLTGRVTLAQHSSDVIAEIQRLCDSLDVPQDLATTLATTAQFHDLGKADPRFQAMLTGKPLHVAYMQPRLWAKSNGRSIQQRGVLPESFRHEMVSLSLVDHFSVADEQSDNELLKHVITAHHGYGRPFAPICIDPSPPGINLRELGGGTVPAEERASWVAAHRLDSGISERFWRLNRRYGWWGVAYLESLLRLADWQASAHPGRGDGTLTLVARPEAHPVHVDMRNETQIVLHGIDGSNSLGFLAAVGAFRVLSINSEGKSLYLHWVSHEGAWRPVITSTQGLLDEQTVLDRLHQYLTNPPQLDLFEAIGPNLTITGNRFRVLAKQATEHCSPTDSAISYQRIPADFLAAFGCEALTEDGTPDTLIKDTALRTMSGAGHQHFIAFMRGLVESTERRHLASTLFETWRYQDEGRGANLRFDPADDRRYALRWSNPSNDPSTTMRGANRLAIEAMPMFTTAAVGGKLETTGFTQRRRQPVRWIWPIWSVPIDQETCRSLLQSSSYSRFAEPHSVNGQSWQLTAHACGVEALFMAYRINPTSKYRNFTAAVAI